MVGVSGDFNTVAGGVRLCVEQRAQAGDVVLWSQRGDADGAVGSGRAEGTGEWSGVQVVRDYGEGTVLPEDTAHSARATDATDRFEHRRAVVGDAGEPDGPGVAARAAVAADAAAATEGARDLDVLGVLHHDLGGGAELVDDDLDVRRPGDELGGRAGSAVAPGAARRTGATGHADAHAAVLPAHQGHRPAVAAGSAVAAVPAGTSFEPGWGVLGRGAAIARARGVGTGGVDEQTVAYELVGDDDERMSPDAQIGLLDDPPSQDVQ